jgi:hypothetical protein
MSRTIASSLTQLLGIEKQKYLEEQAEHGGTAEGFRLRMRGQYESDPLKFGAYILDALMQAVTKKWQDSPRNTGPDLFSIAKVSIPEVLTRTAAGWYEGDDEEEKFEKVLQTFGTVNDLFEDAQIKMRKAAQSSAAAERQMRQVDEARRRSKGRMDTFLRDVADA